MNNRVAKATRLGLGMAALVVVGGIMAGCPPPPSAPPAAPVVSSAPPPFEYKTRTGRPIAISQDPNLIKGLVAQRGFGARPDPFALLGTERSFDQSQTSERVLNEIGGFSTMAEPEVEVVDTSEVVEPQPYRRLAGVLVGDTVSAIIIMEDGSAHLIKPGMMIPNSPWRVVSIDEEKAVLRRAGNRKPTQIIVRLETPPGGVPAPGGGGGGPAGGPGGPGGLAEPGGGPAAPGGGRGGGIR